MGPRVAVNKITDPQASGRREKYAPHMTISEIEGGQVAVHTFGSNPEGTNGVLERHTFRSITEAIDTLAPGVDREMFIEALQSKQLRSLYRDSNTKYSLDRSWALKLSGLDRSVLKNCKRGTLPVAAFSTAVDTKGSPKQVAKLYLETADFIDEVSCRNRDLNLWKGQKSKELPYENGSIIASIFSRDNPDFEVRITRNGDLVYDAALVAKAKAEAIKCVPRGDPPSWSGLTSSDNASSGSKTGDKRKR